MNTQPMMYTILSPDLRLALGKNRETLPIFCKKIFTFLLQFGNTYPII